MCPPCLYRPSHSAETGIRLEAGAAAAAARTAAAHTTLSYHDILSALARPRTGRRRGLETRPECENGPSSEGRQIPADAAPAHTLITSPAHDCRTAPCGDGGRIYVWKCETRLTAQRDGTHSLMHYAPAHQRSDTRQPQASRLGNRALGRSRLHCNSLRRPAGGRRASARGRQAARQSFTAAVQSRPCPAAAPSHAVHTVPGTRRHTQGVVTTPASAGQIDGNGRLSTGRHCYREPSIPTL
jgi:hypothetical protein